MRANGGVELHSNRFTFVLLFVLLVNPCAVAQQPGEGVPSRKPPHGLNGDFHRFRVTSPHQARETGLRVLLPDDFDVRRRYRTLFVLPVHEEGVHEHGDGMLEIRKLGFHNQHQLICVAPSFTSKPWYADHDRNRQKQDESHLLKTVIPFVEEQFPVSGERRLLIGFSKSGWGAATLLLRHPDTFHRAVAWDIGIRVDTGPINEVERAERIARDFGSPENFEAYRLSNLIKRRGKSLGDRARLFYYSTEGRRALGGIEIHRLLVENGVPHRYLMEPRRKHAWGSGWIPAAIAFLVAE